MDQPDLPNPEPGRHDKEARQRALVDAAMATFAEHGYAGATTRTIAARAGCAEGLIGRYFGGKRGLLVAGLEERSALIAHDFEASVPECETVEEEIRLIFAHAHRTYWAKRDTVGVILSQALLDGDVGRAVAQFIDGVRARAIEKRLRRHRDLGRISASADLAAIAHAISLGAFATGFFAQVALRTPAAALDETINELARTLAQGLTPAPGDAAGTE